MNVPGAEKIPIPGKIHAQHFILISGQECVETHVTSGTGTVSQVSPGDKSRIRHRTIKVRTPVDQEWHEAKYRPRPSKGHDPSSGRILVRPINNSMERPIRGK